LQRFEVLEQRVKSTDRLWHLDAKLAALRNET
jgi:hypothetical protein